MFDLSKEKVEARLDIDLLPFAKFIERQLHGCLLAPPEGLYRFDKVEPVLIPGGKYYVQDSTGARTIIPYDDLVRMTARPTVYDQTGKVMVPAAVFRTTSALTTTPEFPYRGIRIASIILDHQVDSFIQWRKNRGNHVGLLYNQLDAAALPEKPEERDALIDWLLEGMGSRVTDELYDWFDGKSWNVFLTRHKNARYLIERYPDYRILDWMDRYAEGEITL